LLAWTVSRRTAHLAELPFVAEDLQPAHVLEESPLWIHSSDNGRAAPLVGKLKELVKRQPLLLSRDRRVT
jgi:hypothetical protein